MLIVLSAAKAVTFGMAFDAYRKEAGEKEDGYADPAPHLLNGDTQFLALLFHEISPLAALDFCVIVIYN